MKVQEAVADAMTNYAGSIALENLVNRSDRRCRIGKITWKRPLTLSEAFARVKQPTAPHA